MNQNSKSLFNMATNATFFYLLSASRFLFKIIRKISKNFGWTLWNVS